MSATTSQPDPVAPLVQRLVAASGIAFAVLFLVAFFISGGETPEDGAPLAEWTEFARDNEANARIGALVMGLAAYSFFLFLGYLRAAIGAAEQSARGFTRGGYIVLAAGTAGIAGLTIAIALAAIAITEPDTTSPEIIRATYEFSGAGFVLASAAFGACFVTVGLVNAGVRALPAWLGWVALVCGISFVLQLGILLSEDEDNLFWVFYPLSFVLLIVFCAGASVHFLKELNRTTAGASTPPPSG
jgi:hypothetical protein